ncbi:unnamed protein product [Euphydryas editha]|uniref:GIY-YIG domain-containing protein n=1 Tax=Euphydryas editha TaxID=104508 RepID=A0AAU9V2E8_EUPED|nr:unnamed protein product [Euphydryas editha]
MERYTIEQRVFFVEYYRNNNESLVVGNIIYTSSTVKRLIKTFMETGSNGYTKLTVHMSISKQSSLQCILTKNRGAHAYKIQLTQQLKPNTMHAIAKRGR